MVYSQLVTKVIFKSSWNDCAGIAFILFCYNLQLITIFIISIIIQSVFSHTVIFRTIKRMEFS
ncbi:hypothetical protein X975_04496, partial [Stegodyphus mimosarum]